MRVNLEWLREHAELTEDAGTIADRLSLAGLEVGAVEPVAVPLQDVVTAEVLAAEQHPDADRLKVCRVVDGSGEELQIVCGAPNARTGMKAVLVRAGGRLGDLKVRRSKLRGVESQGMLCSARELGLGDEHDGIIELPADTEVGQDVVALLQLDDIVLELELTPNRGDCLGVIGVARELGAILERPVQAFEPAPVTAAHAEVLPTRVEDPVGCPRLASRVVTGLDPAAETPIWLRERLRRAGMRPISPAVDVTNYVMLETGQPMHAYDRRQLDGAMVVRRATPGEQLTLLDGRAVTLDPEVLVIADESKVIGMAGIMGGEHTGIADDTTEVVFECAYFDPATIAGRARRYGLHTDASQRFERGVDPAGQERALERATALLTEIAGGAAGPSCMEAPAQHQPQRPAVALDGGRIERLLGLAVPGPRCRGILESLGMRVEGPADGPWQVTPPSFRFDISQPEDLIEEVARIHGYDRIPETPAPNPERMGQRGETRIERGSLRRLLVGRGYHEVITYSFVDPQLQAQLLPEVPVLELANPISQDLAVMRCSLLPGLVATAKANLDRQVERMKLFELGMRYHSKESAQGTDIEEVLTLAGLVVGDAAPVAWDAASRAADAYDLKGDLEALLSATGATLRSEAGEHPSLHPGQSAQLRLDHGDGEREIGWMGRLHPRIARDLGLSAEPLVFELDLEALLATRLPAAVPVPRYPTVRRDLAVVVPEELAVQALVDGVLEAGRGLIRSARPFDVYRGQGVETGLKSVALALILQDSSRTLTDEDADGLMASVVSALEAAFGARIRA